MFTIAFIPYRILTCFKRIIQNAGAKLQIKNEIFLRRRDKISFLTFIPPIHYYIYWCLSQWCARSHPFVSLLMTAVLVFSPCGLLFSWLRLCLLTSIAVCAVFCNPSSFSRSPRVWLQPVFLSGIRIIPAASVLMADRMLSFTSSMFSGLLRESVLLAETSWIASFTG